MSLKKETTPSVETLETLQLQVLTENKHWFYTLTDLQLFQFRSVSVGPDWIKDKLLPESVSVTLTMVKVTKYIYLNTVLK